MTITTQHVYTAATAAMFLAAGFLVVNLLIAAGRVLRGKDKVSELPTRLIGVGIALALALTAWPYIRTAILDTIGQDAPGMVQTINNLGTLSDSVGSVATAGTEGLDAFSSQTWGDVGTAIQGMLSAPNPATWNSNTQPQSTAAEEASDVFKPMEADGETLAGEMSVNDSNLPPTFPVRVPAPMPSQASHQGATITPQLQRTVERNSSWLGFMSDENGQPLTGGMSQEAPNMSVQSWDDAPNMSVDPTTSTGTGNSIFKPLNGGGGPTHPPVEPAQQTIKRQSVNAYTVKPGDTMFKIASWYYGNGRHMIAICTANPQVKNCNALQVGEVLVLPSL